MGIFANEAMIVGILAGTILLAVPVLAAAVGEILAERSGVLNLGLEGLMLVGAFTGFVGAFYSGSLWVGVMSAVLAGGFLAAVHAFVSVTLSGDQIISGLAIVILGEGLVLYGYRAIFGVGSNPARIDGFAPLQLPVLSELPYVGPILFSQNALTYLILLITAITWVVLFRTKLGLRIKGVGENPAAADAMGVDVISIRYVCVIVGGGLSGLGGAFLTLGHLNMYVDNISAGRGWMALALVIFARWNPGWALAGACLFGFVDMVQLRAQNLGIDVPVQLLLMLPYVLTILALLVVGRRAGMPRSLTLPYKRGS